MDRPLIVPKIVTIGLGVMVMLIIITGFAYWFETSHLGNTNNATPLFDLFSDAFKVALGAFIGVMSQWASGVFGKDDAAGPRKTRE